jgi:nucleoside-diphosphate-sugar epimerase
MSSNNTKPVSVVTGGAGFLGSHLTDRLLKEGHRVIAVDNLITGNVANIEHLAGNKDYKFINHDVTDFIYIPGQAFRLAREPDRLFEDSDPDAESRLARHAQRAWVGEGQRRGVLPCFHLRVLR